MPSHAFNEATPSSRPTAEAQLTRAVEVEEDLGIHFIETPRSPSYEFFSDDCEAIVSNDHHHEWCDSSYISSAYSGHGVFTISNFKILDSQYAVVFGEGWL